MFLNIAARQLPAANSMFQYTPKLPKSQLIQGICAKKVTDKTIEELFFFIHEKIIELGYVNLDFPGNLGHSIVKDKNQRIYIEKRNTAKLLSVEAFTFEPHIRRQNGNYGFKHENIYYFKNNKLFEL